MKKPHMRTIIGYSRRNCILITLFQLYSSRAGVFEGDLFWVGQYEPQTLTLEEELTQYKHNLTQFLINIFFFAIKQPP